MNKINKKQYFNMITIYSLLLCLGVIIISMGFSAFQSSMEISDSIAILRIEKDIRVTGIRITNTINSGNSVYEEYSWSSFSSDINLPHDNSKVTYAVTVTNIGNAEMGITEVSDLPENLTYTIDGYEIGSTLCDDNDNEKCKLGSVTTLYITIGYAEGAFDSSNISQSINMNFTFDDIDAVARIGDKYYDSLSEAITQGVDTDNAETTVVLLKNTSDTFTILEGQNVNLDLQNFTLSNKGSTNIIQNYGTLHLSNGIITSSASQGAINNYGSLYMNGGKIIATADKQAIYNDGGKVEISGTAYLSATSSVRAPVHNNKAAGSIKILGGTIISTRFYGVQNGNGTLEIGTKDGNININNPEIRGKDYAIKADAKFKYYDGVLEGQKGTIDKESNLVDTEPGYGILLENILIDKVNYKAGHLAIVDTISFNPMEGSVDETYRNVEKGTKIGKLPVPIREEYIFDGWFTIDDVEITDEYIVNGDLELYAHWTHSSEVYVAMINDTKYHTLAEAIEAAPGGNTITTITMIRNARENVSIDKKIILDTQKYTLSNADATAVITVTKYGNLTITGGKITSTSATTSIINNSGVLTINGGTLSATGLRQVIYNDGGTVNISGDAYLIATAPERATVQNHTSASIINIYGGTIESKKFSAVNNEFGKIYIGTKDGTINTSSPTLIGHEYGFLNNTTNNATFYFYDGTIKGESDAISGSYTEIEDNSTYFTSREVVDGVTYHIAYLN